MDERIIGVDIGGTHFRIGSVGPRDELEVFHKLPVRQVFRTRDPLADLARCLKEFLRSLPGEGRTAEAAVIGFPATLDAERRAVMQAPNLPFMENLPVAEVLTRELAMPVFIERDVTIALLCDLARYSIPARGVVAGFYFGTGIGNAICVNGVPFAGADGAAGELGHIPVDGSEEPCGCGNVGCLENLAGGKYLARLCRDVYVDTPVGSLFSAHGDEPVLRQFVDRMAMAVATEVNILNPDSVLIGGGVPNMPDFPRRHMVERIKARARKPYPADSLNVIFTEDADEKCVMGASYYARLRSSGAAGVGRGMNGGRPG